jgi:predicted TIM-barrel fold metal-dependent hydrolase
MRIIDTHQHLWDTSAFRYAWLESLPQLNHSFLLDDYKEATKGLEVERTVFVECDVDEQQMQDEAIHILRLAEDPANRIAGVIASARPEKNEFKNQIERLCSHKKVKGIRRILHTQPDDLGRGSLFVENIATLADYGLSFDICVLARQLPIATGLVERCPNVTFVLDHCGVPDLKEGTLHPWQKHIRLISQFPNVFCKVSGIVAYGDPTQWTPDNLRPFVNHIIASFGWDRVMFGSDWPVCTLAATYRQWLDALISLTASGGISNQEKLFHDNAVRAYHLE